jgi:hypothetical protein
MSVSSRHAAPLPARHIDPRPTPLPGERPPKGCSPPAADTSTPKE